MKAKYEGDPANPGEQVPDEFTAYGLTFEKGKYTEIPAHLEGKFVGNTHFKVMGAAETKAD